MSALELFEEIGFIAADIRRLEKIIGAFRKLERESSDEGESVRVTKENFETLRALVDDE